MLTTCAVHDNEMRGLVWRTPTLYAVFKIVNRNAIGMSKERDQWGQVTDVIALAAIATSTGRAAVRGAALQIK